MGRSIASASLFVLTKRNWLQSKTFSEQQQQKNNRAGVTPAQCNDTGEKGIPEYLLRFIFIMQLLG